MLAGGTGGLYRIRDGLAEAVTLEGVASVGTILSLVASRDGDVWVGSDLGMVWKGDAVMRRHPMSDQLRGSSRRGRWPRTKTGISGWVATWAWPAGMASD